MQYIRVCAGHLRSSTLWEFGSKFFRRNVSRYGSFYYIIILYQLFFQKKLTCLQMLVLFLVLQGSWIKTQKLLRSVIEETSRFHDLRMWFFSARHFTLCTESKNCVQETVSSKAKENNNGAAASNSHESVQTVNCGICMDNVYEKRPPRDNVFGILPNCNHSFCKQCITTWRKMRDYGPDVVK